MAAAPQRHITPDLVRDALSVIPPDVDRETWVRLAMAIKSELSADGFELWDAWSRQAATYREADAKDTWRSVKPGGRVTIGTLFGIAKDHGFRFPDDSAAPPTAPELAKLEADRLARQQRRDAEEASYRERADKAVREAAKLWAKGKAPATAAASPYLARKGVQAHGVRVLADGTLLVPMLSEAGVLVNVQRIAPRPPTAEEESRGAREKLYMPGGRKKGARAWLGDPAVAVATAAPGAAVLCLAEGYATAASGLEASGWPVAVCFDTVGLLEVAKSLPAQFPGAAFLVLTDDDAATHARTGKNPGRVAAGQAVRALRAAGARAVAVVPSGHAPDTNADFNDMHLAQGLDAVRAVLQAGAAELGSEPTNARHTGAESKAQGPRPGRHGKAPAPPSEPPALPPGAESAGERDPFRLDAAGVWFTARDAEGNAKRPEWVCAPLSVSASTRSEAAEGWGYLLEFTDPDGNAKRWAMPSALLAGEGSEWAGRLRDMGLRIAPGSRTRNLLARYIDTRHPGERVTCTDRVGWHGAACYVLPAGVITPQADDAGQPGAELDADASGSAPRRFVFQSEAGMDNTFHSRGSLADWQRLVAGPCAGNSRLVFALSLGLAGPLLWPAKLESGGFHYRGGSSMGKTTALRVAASVFGRPSYMQRWRTTDNALEAIAVQHCDALLILDEFGQLDPKVAGECAYLLANEQEKGRGTRGGLARRRRTWRLLFLSSGEIGLADHMAEVGKRTRAGQEVRMVDIPLDAGVGMGGLEVIHGAESPGAFVEQLTRAAATHYGTAGRAVIEWAAQHMATLPARLHALIENYREQFTPAHAAEQVRRVATRFALVAAAGELGTEAGITGWRKGEALEAGRRCFNAWLMARGHADNGEDVAMVGQVRAYLEKNGDALFTWSHRAADDHRPNTAMRSGFKRLIDDEGRPLKFDSATEYLEKGIAKGQREADHASIEYFVLPEAFKREVCKGLDWNVVAKLLRAQGHLVHEKGKLTNKVRIPTMGKATVPVFHIKASIFEAD